jgi:hypothetical protein
MLEPEEKHAGVEAGGQWEGSMGGLSAHGGYKNTGKPGLMVHTCNSST